MLGTFRPPARNLDTDLAARMRETTDTSSKNAGREERYRITQESPQCVRDGASLPFLNLEWQPESRGWTSSLAQRRSDENQARTKSVLVGNVPDAPKARPYVFWSVAPRHGFEPRFTAPKAAVPPKMLLR